MGEKRRTFDLILLLGLGLLSISWFRGDFIIDAGDYNLPIFRSQLLYKSIQNWDGLTLMGVPSPRTIALLIPYALFACFTELIKIPLVLFQKAIFYIIFVTSGLSMYYLCQAIGWKRFDRLAASIFYMMNPFSLILIWNVSNGLIQPVYASAPLIFGMYIKGLKSQRGIRFAVWMAIVWFLTTTFIYCWPPAVPIHWAPLFIYFIYYMSINRNQKERLMAIRFTTSLIVIWLSLNLFWLLPFVSDFTQQMESAYLPCIIPDIETFRLNSSKLLDAIRLMGYWGLHADYKGDPYYVYHSSYNSSSFLVLSFLPPFLAFFPFLLKRRDEYIIFTGLFIIICLFLIKGHYPPLGGYTNWIFQYLPYLGRAIRFPLLKFGIPLLMVYAPLVGLGIGELSRYLSCRLGKAFLIPILFLFILLFGALVYPFWSGDVIYPGGSIIPSARIKIPQDYYNLREWLNNQKDDFRIFSLPMAKIFYVAYKWRYGFVGTDITQWFTSDKPLIWYNTGNTFFIPMLIAKEISSKKRNLSSLFGLLNVRYVILHHDTNWEYIKDHPWWFKHSPEDIESFLASQAGLSLDREFGHLSIYRLNDRYFLPHISASTKPILIDGDVDILSILVNTKYIEQRPALFFLNQQKKEMIPRLFENVKTIENPSPKEIKFRRINMTRFNVKLKGSKGPFFLVFSESYHPGWKAYLRQGTRSRCEWSGMLSALMDLGKRRELKEHYIVNSYANAWYVPEIGNNQEIVIEYRPQRIFEIGLFISGLILIGCIGYLAWTLREERTI